MAITISVNVSRTSGAAPLGVVFDASGTTSGATTKPFFDLKYSWDFGGGVAAFTQSGKSSATGFGPIQARVFTSQSTVVLTVTEPGGASAQWVQAISANNAYSWSNTYYFDPVGGSDSLPNDGSQALPFRSWDKAMSLAGAGVRCILLPGTYSDTGSGRTLATNNGPFQVESLYSNNKAIIQKSGTSGLVSPGNSTDCRFIDIDFRGLGADTANGDAMTSLAPNQLVWRCAFQNWDASIRKGTTAATNDGVVISSNSFTSCASYQFYDDIVSETAGRYHRYCALLDNSISGSLSQPITRIWWQQSCVICNVFGAGFSARPQLRWQGRNGAAEVASYCYIADNVCSNAGTGAEINFQLAAAANTDIGLMSWVLVERNSSTQTAGTDKRFVQVTSQIANLCVRENLIVGVTRGVYVDSTHDSCTHDSWEIYDNTFYHAHASATGRRLFEQANDTNAKIITSIVFRNNIISVPLTTGGRVLMFNGFQDDAVITSTDNDIYTPLVSGGDAALLVNCDVNDDGTAEALSWTAWAAAGYDSGSIRTDPAFTDVNTGDYSLSDSSPCLEIGYAMALPIVDLDGVARPQDGDGAGGAAWDIGALEATPPLDPPDPPATTYRVTTCVVAGFGAADVGTVIANAGDELPAAYEPSGATWNSELSKLFIVHDGGRISYMNADGTSVVNVPAAGNFANPPDFEGICVAHPESNFVYGVCERNNPGGADNRNSIQEINYVTEALVRTFILDGVSGFTTPAVNSGAEGITFVPNAFLASPSTTETGLFFVGIQETAVIHRFELTIDSSAVATTVTHKGSFASGFATEVAGLDFDQNEGILWAISDADNKIRALKPDGTLIAEWTAPTDSGNQEGISVNGTTLFVSDDLGNVRSYDFARGGTLDVKTGVYANGSTVTITATPVSGKQVKTWTGTDDNGSDNLVNRVTLSGAAVVVTCEFEDIPAPSPSTVSSTWQSRQRRRGCV